MKNEQPKINDGKIFNADYSSLVSASDLTYRGQIDFGPQGMPVANGRFGGPVWEPSGRVLAMQLNHTDVFMYNDASAESTYDNGALGKLEIDFGEDVFGEDTLNALSLYDAKLTVTGSDVSCEVISSPDSDTILLRITDSRAEPKDITVTLNMLRSPEAAAQATSPTRWSPRRRPQNNFWQKYIYTGDETWLREHAYKFIKGAAELYRNYYGFVKEDDGKYHFNRTNLHEHIWAGRDVIDDLSLARGYLPSQ